ncbi:MAG TPA: alpha/beta fold hydrolase [Candidatus Binataceae bacterium]|nr:alpha/beta fold hydrolase [Candidatus Binataceae bacterium]
MPEIRVNDVKLHYDVQGSGDPLLMVMGLGSSSATWHPELIGGLARHFRVITYDNRGTGLSDKPDIPYSLEMFAADAIGLLDHLKLDRVHVFGVSMGGMIGQELGLRHAPRLQTLTLGCTTCGGKNAVPPPPESIKLLTAPRDGASEEEIIRRGWPLAYTADFIKNHRAELEAGIPRLLANPTPVFAYKRHLDATYGLKTFDRLPSISTPTLVITGAEDVLIPAKNSEIIASRVPNARLHIMPKLGHAFFNEGREEFIKAFAPFPQAHPIAP